MASRVLSLSVGAIGALVAYNDKPMFTTEQSLYFGIVTFVNGTIVSVSKPSIAFPYAMGGALVAHTVMFGMGYSLGLVAKSLIKE